MSYLSQRMIEDLQLRGMSERTQEMYVRAVRQLAEHYQRSPVSPRKTPSTLYSNDLRKS